TVKTVDTDLAGIDALITPKTKAFYVETPTNPTLRLVDLEKGVAFAKRHKLVSLIDNTFGTPLLQKPVTMGFDLALHSATKYLAGHSDVIAGAAVGSTERMKRVREMVIALGGCMDPEAAFLLARGMKTLGLRLARQEANAMAIAEFLEKHSKVERVHYPGL